MTTSPCDLSPPPGGFEACQACQSVPSQCLQGVYGLQAYFGTLWHALKRAVRLEAVQACRAASNQWSVVGLGSKFKVRADKKNWNGGNRLIIAWNRRMNHRMLST